MKHCNRCGKDKPPEAFHQDKSRKDGRHPYCAECQTKKASQWCRENRERAQVNSRNYKKRNRKRVTQQNRAYDERNREKRRAHVQARKLKGPAKCERCGRKKKLQKHHPDYSQPLHVEWLCALCHVRHHTEEKRAHAHS